MSSGSAISYGRIGTIARYLSGAALRRGVAALGMAREAVVRDRLPGGGVGDELADARPDPGVLVERAHADADRIGVAGVIRVDLRAADAAEPLLAAVLGLPHAQGILAGDDPERPLSRVRARRHRRAGAALAAPAVAVARLHERRGDLEPDGTAVAAAGQRELGHRRQCATVNRRREWRGFSASSSMAMAKSSIVIRLLPSPSASRGSPPTR